MIFEKRDFYPGRKQKLLANAQTCQLTNDQITVNLQNTVEIAISNDYIQTDMTAMQYSLLLWSALSGIISIALERQSILTTVYD